MPPREYGGGKGTQRMTDRDGLRAKLEEKKREHKKSVTGTGAAPNRPATPAQASGGNSKQAWDAVATEASKEQQARKKADAEKDNKDADAKAQQRKAVIQKSLDACSDTVEMYKKAITNFLEKLHKAPKMDNADGFDKPGFEKMKTDIAQIAKDYEGRLGKVQKNAEATKTFKEWTLAEKAKVEKLFKEQSKRWENAETHAWKRKVEEMAKAKKGVYGDYKKDGLGELEKYLMQEDGQERNKNPAQLEKERKEKEEKERPKRRLLDGSYKFQATQLLSKGFYFGEDLAEFKELLKEREKMEALKKRKRDEDNEVGDNKDGGAHPANGTMSSPAPEAGANDATGTASMSMSATKKRRVLEGVIYICANNSDDEGEEERSEVGSDWLAVA